MPDVLDIVVVLEDVEHLFHVGDILGVLELLIVLRHHFDLRRLELVALVLERLGNVVKISGVGVDREAALFRLEVGSARVERVHHDRVFLELFFLVVDDDDALLVERPAHAAVYAEASAGQGDSYESITYEGHGPSGVAVIVETMTDNRNRTAGNIRHHFDKYGGSLGVNGCVSWAFDKKGVIVIDNEDEDLDEDTVMMDALDAGAADFQPEEGCFTVYTDPADFNDVAKALEDKGYKFESAQIEMVPQNYQKLENPEDISNMEKMLDIFEDDDDVQNVWHNWDQE